MGELLKVSGLDVQRGRKEVLKGFDLEISPGELVIISGENGSGKSTLIEAVAGIIPPQSGSIHVHGKLLADGHGRRSRPGSSDYAFKQTDSLVMKSFTAITRCRQIIRKDI